MTLPFFTLPPVYLMDTCSVIRLDGKDRPPIQEFSTVERALIWKGLEDLANEGRLKLIKQVKEELGRHHPQGLARLKQYPGQKLILKRSAEVIRLYRTITNNHPDLMKGGSRFDPADPWLIVAAELYDYTIVTEELLKAARTTTATRSRNQERIPDVCNARGLKSSIRLRELALNEGWF